MLLHLDPASGEPLFRQVYAGVRSAVLAGQLAAGVRLPPTRDLARELGVSRNTVLLAFRQLMAEGYLEGRVGAGTYVSAAPPDAMLRAERARSRRKRPAPSMALSDRGSALASISVSAPRATPGIAPRAFRIGVPDTASFPFAEWARIVARIWRDPEAELLAYGDPQGYEPLRAAIAAHAGAARGVRCDASQIIIVNGSQQALDLAARLLIDPGDPVWMEDPGYLGARAALQAAGARLVAVPLDDEGIDVAAGVRMQGDARLAYVTPSHQFPAGTAAMSLRRRFELLQWAEQAKAWIIEDDYDSEYRYAGRPITALQGLDGGERVIYVGTFSKVMFPSLRLGYVIVPPQLVDAFVRARALADRHGPSVEQAALAEFMRAGQLERHIRRMRARYAERQTLLVDLLRRQTRGRLDVRASETGLHLTAWLPDGVDDRAVSARLAAAGVDAAPISAYRMTSQGRGALLLGFAAYEARAIAAGVRVIAGVL